MADGDYYASYPDVRNLLNEQSIGGAASTLYTENSLELALSVSQAYIHQYLGLTSMACTTNPVHVATLKAIQIDLIMMRILQAKHINQNNLTEAGAIQSFWQVMPYLTNAHKQLLDRIADQLEGVAWTFDVRTGSEVNY